MELNIDIIEQIRKTVDWIKDNFKEVKTNEEKDKLNVIINDISDLIIHKNEYLYRLNEVKSSEQQLKTEIKKSLEIAEADIKKLASDIKNTELKAGTLGLLLNTKLNSLANIKMTEIERFNNLWTGLTNNDINKIIETLSLYKDKWLEIGNEIEKLKRAL